MPAIITCKEARDEAPPTAVVTPKLKVKVLDRVRGLAYLPAAGRFAIGHPRISRISNSTIRSLGRISGGVFCFSAVAYPEFIDEEETTKHLRSTNAAQ